MDAEGRRVSGRPPGPRAADRWIREKTDRPGYAEGLRADRAVRGVLAGVLLSGVGMMRWEAACGVFLLRGNRREKHTFNFVE